MKTKKTAMLLILLLVAMSLTACGTPKIEISENPKQDFSLIYSGTTDKGADVTLKDSAGNNKEIEVNDDGDFEIYIPRSTSKQSFSIQSELDEKKTTYDLTVPKSKSLVDLDFLRDQFNYISETEDNLTIEFPDELLPAGDVDSVKKVSNGFVVSTDGNQVLAISLSYDAYGGMSDYGDFIYSIGAISVALDAGDDGTKIIKAIENCKDTGEKTSVTVANVVYNFEPIGSNYMSAEIYPK